MKIFPGIDTMKERKKFAVFHACTFILCSLIVMLIMWLTYLNHSNPHNNPFGAGMKDWLLLSLFIWNLLGAWRFMCDLGFIVGRIVGALLMIGFPLFYLHNLWCILRNKDIDEEG